jgi:hypothetical protein
MLIQILVHTPLWVWAMLLGLLALGLWQCRARSVRRAQILALPLVLLGLGLWSMAPAFVALPLTFGVWLAAFLTSAAWARRWAPPAAARWLVPEQRLQLPGSWLPLVIILVIFSLRYGTGVSLALHPEWRGLLAVQMPLALSFGALSGLFMGRALGLWAVTRGAQSSLRPDSGLAAQFNRP